MDTNPSNQQKNHEVGPPGPEVLVPRSDESTAANDAAESSATSTAASSVAHSVARHSYRPSHRATFIGIGVIVLILAVNGGIVAFILKHQSSQTNQGPQGQVTINQSVLNNLGVNRSAVGDAGIQLTIGPNTRFKGNVIMDGNTSIAGQLSLNSKFSATDANLVQLEAGNTTLNQLNVNGTSTVSTLNLRGDLTVAGVTHLQSATTVSQLLTASTNLNVGQNLSVGGVISTSSINANTVTAVNLLTIGGHVITAGSAPAISGGTALGSNGTVSISGNDAAGTVAINIGVGAGTGSLAFITFHTHYTTTPHVTISPVGIGGSFYINRSTTGFSIYTMTALPPGGYAFDYIVEQ